MMDLFESEMTKPEILLLDYQATLVSNFWERNAWREKNEYAPYTEWIKKERLRSWIPRLAQKEGVKVILITARSAKYKKQTLEHIKQVLGWMPDEWYFNEENKAPQYCKRDVLHRYIYRKYGYDKKRYVAFESNKVTREMYTKEGIYSLRVGDEPLEQIPKV